MIYCNGSFTSVFQTFLFLIFLGLQQGHHMVTPTNGYTARGLGLTLGGNTLQSIPVSDAEVISTNSHLTGKKQAFLMYILDFFNMNDSYDDIYYGILRLNNMVHFAELTLLNAK
jgi:hypothetical protein